MDSSPLPFQGYNSPLKSSWLVPCFTESQKKIQLRRPEAEYRQVLKELSSIYRLIWCYYKCQNIILSIKNG